jgi:hypothetical protein
LPCHFDRGSDATERRNLLDEEQTCTESLIGDLQAANLPSLPAETSSVIPTRGPTTSARRGGISLKECTTEKGEHTCSFPGKPSCGQVDIQEGCFAPHKEFFGLEALSSD